LLDAGSEQRGRHHKTVVLPRNAIRGVDLVGAK